MMISDGAPVDDCTCRSIRATIWSAICARHRGDRDRSPVELIAIGIGHDVTRYYRRAVTIVDAEELAGAMTDQLAALSDQTRFGAFEFIGGLELSSPSSMLGAMSAIRLSADRQSFLGVMDTGFWYAGRFERGLKGELTGIVDFSVASMLDADGESSEEKWRVDAEGLAVRGDEVLVSFERRSRVDVYPADAPGSSRPTGTLPLQIPSRGTSQQPRPGGHHGGAGRFAAGRRGGCRLREKSRCQW
jgi:hypothetical protein